MSLVSHDPIAREELHKEEVEGDCWECGSSNRRGRVFAYWIEEDDSLSRKRHYVKGLFCSIGCMRIYHS